MFLSAFIGFLWGLNEGLWFFVIPDIGLSLIALKGWRHAAIATLMTVIGAGLASMILYLIFYVNSSSDILTRTENFWSALPGFYPKMLQMASQHLSESGALGLLSGPNSGIPYRFYVLEAYKQGVSLASILTWTPIARLERIALAPILVLIIKFLLQRFLINRTPRVTERGVNVTLTAVISVYWMGVYIWYWFYFLPEKYS